MNKNSSIEHQFISKWHQAKELPIPNAVDQSMEKSVLDAYECHNSNLASSQGKPSYAWLYSVAAGLLVTLASWQFLFQEQLFSYELSQPNAMLVIAVEESKELEARFDSLRQQSLSEFIYVQRFKLEKELQLVNTQLAEAYMSHDSLQEKLQLWHQKNKTLSQLNALIENSDSTHVTHI